MIGQLMFDPATESNGPHHKHLDYQYMWAPTVQVIWLKKWKLDRLGSNLPNGVN